jgi:hypothetical protein
MAALKEIRDLFGIGAAEADGRKGTRGERDFTLEALVKRGAVRIGTRWSELTDTTRSKNDPG